MKAKRISAIVLGLICLAMGLLLWAWLANQTLDFPARGTEAATLQLNPKGLPAAPGPAPAPEPFSQAWPLLFLFTGALLLLAGIGGFVVDRRKRANPLTDTSPPNSQSS